MSQEQDQFLELFNEELSSLNLSLEDFGKHYPHAVSHLQMAPNSPDPHIRLLMESFAFLVARIGTRVEKFKGYVPEALLNKISPGLIEAVPSIGFAKLQIDRETPPSVDGFAVPKNSRLTAIADDHVQCRFTTCYDVNIYPIKISSPVFESPNERGLFGPETFSVVSFSITGVDVTLSEVQQNKLRIFIDADYSSAGKLRELILGKSTDIFLVDRSSGLSKKLNAEVIQPVGFQLSDSVLNDTLDEHPALRLLREFHVEPNKFMFFDLNDIIFPPMISSVQLLIGINENPPKSLSISKVKFENHVTPIINSFEMLAEPVRLNSSQTEFLINPELGREDLYEILRVNNVELTMPGIANAIEVPSIFDHGPSNNDNNLSWSVKFENSFGKTSSQAKLSLLGDLELNESLLNGFVLAKVTCQNVGLPQQLSPGTRLFPNSEIPAKAEIMRFPTKSIKRQSDNDSVWKLASHLDFSLADFFVDNDAKASAKKISAFLKTYAPQENANLLSDLDGITNFYFKTDVFRRPFKGSVDFVEGISVFMVIDPALLVRTNIYLLCDIINEILSMLIAVNSFCQLHVALSDNPEKWVKWKPGRYGKSVI